MSRIILIVVLLNIFLTATSQNLYWVGGSGNWNDPQHWSYAPGGNGGVGIPTKSTDVYFDEKSFSPEDDFILVKENIYCRNFSDLTSGFRIISSSSEDFFISGNKFIGNPSVLNQFYGILIFDNSNNLNISIPGEIGGSVLFDNCRKVFIKNPVNILKNIQLINSEVISDYPIKCKNIYTNNEISENINYTNLFKSDKPIDNEGNKAVFTLTNPSSTTTETCYGFCDGTITISLASGSPVFPLTITVNRPNGGGCTGASKTYTNILSLPYTIVENGFICGCGVAYSVNVKDFENTSRWTSASVTGPPQMIPIEPEIINPSCFSSCDGSIDLLFIQGATYPIISYTWSSGSSTEIADNLCAGSYTYVTVIDGNSCTAEFTFDPLTDPTELVISTTYTDVKCNSICDGTAEVTASGGTTPYTYLWDDGGSSTTSSINGLCAGIYHVTVKDANNCEKTATVTISEPAASLSIDDITSTDVSPCNGAANGTITVTVSGGTTPYSYDCGAGTVSGNSITGLNGGTYIVTITDFLGCTETTLPIIINEPSVVNISITAQTNLTCYGACIGSATAQMTGGTTPYTYLWDAGTGNQSTSTASNLCAGIYSVTGTDGTGLCTATTSVTITEPADIDITINKTDPTCNAVCDGSAIAIVSGGITPYTYKWCDNSTNSTINNLCAGTCGITVTDGSLCSKTAEVTIIDPPPFTLSTTQTNVSCNSNCNGSATVTPSGGVSPYTYTWSCTLQTTQTATNLCAGTCTVTVVDNNGTGCQAVKTVTITEPAALTLNITKVNPTCNGFCNGSATAVVSGGTTPYSYTWNDPGSQTTATATGLCAGVYIVTITDGNGCTKTGSVTLTEPTALTLNISKIEPTCNGICDGSATASVGGGTTPYLYLWSPSAGSQATATATGLCEGIHSVTVTDANGCTITGSVTITAPAVLSLTISKAEPSCNGVCDGSATANAGGGTTPYLYLWSPSAGNQTTVTATGLCEGVHSVTVTDANGCTITGSVTITAPAALTLTISKTDPSCNGDCNGTATANVGGGTTPYLYTWSISTGSQTTVTAVDLCAGVHSVTITDANGCTITGSVTLTDPSAIVPVITINDETCSGNCDGGASVSVSGGNSPYTYIWDDSGSSTGTSVSNLCAGTICVTVTDATSCTVTACDNVNSNSFLIPPTIVATNATCAGICDGEIHITVSGGNPPITYQWADGPTTPDRTGLCPATYCVTITDGLGLCSYSECITIVDGAVITININKTDVTCNGPCDGTATASGNGGCTPYTYFWDANAGNQTTATATGLCDETYNVTVMDCNSCQATGSVTIGAPGAINLNFTSTSPTCHGYCDGTATVTASGGTLPYTYQWNDGGATAAQTNTGLCAGVYNVTVKDGNNCEVAGSITITEPTGMTIDFINVQHSLCGSLPVVAGDTTFIPDGNGAEYTSTITHNVFPPTETIDQISDIQSICANMEHSWLGDLEIKIKCPNGQQAILKQGGHVPSDEVFLGEPNENDGYPIDDPAANPPGIGYDYCWSMNATYGTMVDEASVYTTLPSGSYLPYQTFSNLIGCPINGVWTISIIDDWGSDNGYIFTWQLNLDPSTYPPGYCEGTATVSASGTISPYTYEWDYNSETSQTLTDLCGRDYTVTVTDGTGCKESATITINEPDQPLTATTSVTNVTCHGMCNGTATAIVSGGTTPYSYLWDDISGQTTSTATGLCAGIYSCVITDANSCTYSVFVTITEPSNGVTASITAQTNLSCNSVCIGNATVTGSGGTLPYTYLWNDPVPQITQTATDLCAGIYNVTVTDQNMCEGYAIVTITQPNALTANITSHVDVNCTGQNTGSLTVTVTGGTANYNYDWDNAPDTPNTTSTTNTVSNLPAGNYNVTVTDSHACTATASATITEPATALTSTITAQTNVLCNGAATGSATVTAAGGTTPYIYDWSPNGPYLGDGTNTYTNLIAGTYNVTVTDGNSCTATASATITEPLAITISTTITDANCGASDGAISIDVTGGITPYAYSWTGPGTFASNTEDISGLAAGIYNLTVTDGNGCTKTYSGTVNNIGGPSVTITGSTNCTCFGVCNGTATVNVAGGVTPYTYLWSNGETVLNAVALCAGDNTITVTAGNGCIGVASVTITEPSDITITFNQINASCNGVCDGSVTTSVIGGTSPYTYLWSNGATTNNITGLCAGVYDLTVADLNSCTKVTAVTITEPSAITVNILSQTNALCYGACNGTATLNVSGGTTPYTINWPSSETGLNATALCAGTNDITVTDANNCTSLTPITINEPSLFTITSVITDAHCGSADGQIALTVSGATAGYTYDWAPNGPPFTGDGTPTYSNLNAQAYTVTITDANSCDTVYTTAVSNIDGPSISVDNSTDVSCFGLCDGTISITVTGGITPYTYLWSNSSSNEDLTNLCPGTYILTVTGADGCIGTQSVTIGEPTDITLSMSQTDLLCNGVCTGSATVLASGGTSPYIYSWDNASTATTAINLCAGQQCVTVTDNHGCPKTSCVTITEPDPIIGTIGTPSAFLISPSTEIKICFSGTHTWVSDLGFYLVAPDGSTTIELLEATTITYGDCNDGDDIDNFCFSTNSVTPPVVCSMPTPLTGVYASTSPWTPIYGMEPGKGGWSVQIYDCIGQDIGFLTHASMTFTDNATDGSGQVTYNYDSGVIASAINDNSCDALSASIFTAPLTFQVSCHGDCDGKIFATGTGGTPPYSFLWSTTETTDTIQNLCPGDYSVVITDATGCSSDAATVTIIDPPLLTASITAQVDASCNGVCNGSATASGAGGTPPYTFLWSDGQITSTAIDLCAGTYSCTITDSKNCTATTSVTIINTGGPTATITSQTNATCNGVCDGKATVTASGGTTPYSYLWDGGVPGNAATDTSLCAQVYNVTVTDANSCTASASVTITAPPALTANITAQINEKCNGDAIGSLTVSISGGTANYDYDWDIAPDTYGTSDLSNTISTLTANTYNVTVTDSNHCTATASATITEPAAITAAITAQTDVRCNGECNGTASLNVTGGTTPYSILWPNGETGLNATALCAVTGNISITDGNNCISTVPITINEPNQITVTINVTDATCTVANGSAILNTSGGTAPYSYLWNSPNGTGNQINNVFSGTYICTITDANSCTYIATVNINDTNGPNTSIATFTNPKCNGSCDGTATVSATGTATPFTYLWTPGNYVTATVTGLCADVYSVVVKDTNNCQGSSSVTITDPTILTVSITSVNVSCFGKDDGSATATASGGTSPYTYLWDSGAGSQVSSTASNLLDGTYSVTVTDSNGCTAIGSVTITEPAVLSASIASQTNVSCNGECTGDATLSITGGTTPYTINWDGGTGSQTTTTASNLCKGTYSVVITDANACSANTSATITEPTPIVISATITNSHCLQSDGSASITVSGGMSPYTYVWQPTGDIDTDISNVPAGTYIVTVTDDLSCTKEQTINISDSDGPMALIADFNNPSCSGLCDGSATVSATGGTTPYTYLWSPTSQTSLIATNLCDGTHIVTVTDANGCIGITSAIITEPATITVSFSNTDVSCFSECDGTSTAITSGGTSPYTYLWDSNANDQPTSTATNLCANSYTITITDFMGCWISSNTTINSPTILSLLTSQTNVSCNSAATGSATVVASGGTPPYTYLWDVNAGSQPTATATSLGAGTYTATVTDYNHCTATISVTITEPSAIAINSTVNNSTCGNSDGSILTTAIGGVSPYTYSWNTGDFGPDLINIPAGSYILTVFDDNGCSKINAFAVTDMDGPWASITAYINPTCFNDADGSATVTATGTNLPFTYLWDAGADNQITQTATDLSDGIYSVSVTDALHCLGVTTVTITEPPALNVTFSKTDITCNGSCNGNATANVTGGTPGYSYSWDSNASGQTSVTATNLCANTFFLTVTDTHSCTVVSSVAISEPDILSGTISAQNNLDCYSVCDGSATITPTGGTTPYTYLWNTIPATPTATAFNLCAGTYLVTITDFNHCSDITSVTITEPSAIDVTTNITNATCHNSDGSICLVVSGGTPGYAYNWNPSGSGQCLNNIPSNTYYVTITDQNSCEISAFIAVTDINGPVATITDMNQPLCYGSCNGDATVEGSGGVSPYTYLWSPNADNQPTPIASNLCADTYSVTVTDANLCNGVTTVDVTSPDSIAITVNPSNVSCFGQTDGSIDISVSGGTSPYTYLWSNSANTQDLYGLTPGVYCVTVADANGCSNSRCITITEPASALTLTLTSTNITCFGYNNGTVNLTVSGGTTPYTYLWTGGVTTQNLNGLAAGTYCVTVTDAHGCTSEDCVTITSPDEIIIDFMIIDSHCLQSDGCIYSNVSGGISPYSYEWPAGMSYTSVLCNIPSGSYEVTVTDALGCQKTGLSNVSDLGAGTIVFSNIINVDCNGNCNGSVTATLTESTSLTNTYNWSNSDTTDIADTLCAGTVIVTITTDAGCHVIDDVEITEPDQFDLSFVVSNISCFNGNNGSIDLTVSGGTSPYTYDWNPQITQDITNLVAGTYTVTVTDAQNCTASGSATITEPTSAILSSILGTNVLCNGDSTGKGDLTVSGGTSPYIIEWSDGETTEDAISLPAGWNYVTITDAAGCQTIDSIALTEPQAIVLAVTNIVNSHCTLSDGEATIIPGGGMLPYDILWPAPGSQVTFTVTDLSAGIYMPTITDANGCSDSIQVNISDQDAGTITFSNIINEPCYGDTIGSVTAEITGGSSPYSYQWNNAPHNDVTSTIINLQANTYTVVITDASGCISVDSVAITQPASMLLTLAVTDVKCFGGNDGAIDLTVSGGSSPYTYYWNPQTTQDINNLPIGTYNVTVTDNSGCQSDTFALVTEPEQLTANILNKQDVLCYNQCTGSIEINVTGGIEPYNYNWTNGNNSTLAENLCAGIHNATISDDNGCFIILTDTISQPSEIIETITTTNAFCGVCSGSATVSLSGGVSPYEYSWSNSGTTSTVTNLCVNFYDVTISDANGCTENYLVEINDTSSVHVDITELNYVTCNGNCDGSVTVEASGGTSPYTYVWDTAVPQYGPNATSLCTGNYIVIATDQNSCADAEVVNLPDVPAIQITFDIHNISCNGLTDGSITANVSGGASPFTYDWSVSGTENTISNLIEGMYYITVTDANNCTKTDSAQIIEPYTLIAVISNSHDLLCAGNCNGTATAAGFGGTEPYSFLWSDNQTDSTAINLCVGTYKVTVTDAGTCSDTTQITISAPPLLTSVFTDSTQVSCNGGNEGSATITPSGGTSPYTYLWSNNGTTPTISSLTAGIYHVTITDFNGCLDSNWIEITDTSNLDPMLTNVTDISCYGMCDGSMTLSISGGTPPYSPIWSNQETTVTIDNLCEGIYFVTIYDVNMCSRIRFDTIAEPEQLFISASQTTLISCHDSCNAAITLFPAGGSPPYSILWSNNQTDTIATQLCAGKYSATVTDNRGCSIALPDSVSIIAPDILTSDYNIIQSTCEFGTNDGAIQLNVNGGSIPYSFNWSNTSTEQNLAGLESDYYSVTIADASNCIISIDSIFVSPAIIISANAGLDTTICLGQSVTLNGTGGVQFLWNPGISLNDSTIANPIATPIISTEYILTAYESICAGFDTVLVNILPLPDIDAGDNVEIYFNDATVLNASSTIDNLSYLWMPNIDISDTTIYNPEVSPDESIWYYVYGTDENGCRNFDSVYVSIIPLVWFPSGFTPNGDGANDVWVIEFLNYYPNIEVDIFNRWGENVYHSVGYSDPWNGTYQNNGKELPVGTYYYLIDVHIDTKTKPLTGPVTIMR